MNAHRSSYVHGTGSEPLTAMTVADVLDTAANEWPDRDAVVAPHQTIRWSWQGLRTEARALGAGLLASGLEPGDRIGIVAPNLAEWVAVQFGAAYAGLVLVNINPAYRADELEYALEKTGCRAVIAVPAFKTTDYIQMLREIAAPRLKLIVSLGDDRLSGCTRYADVVASADSKRLAVLDRVAAGLDPDDPVNIQFTSGTSGSPKAATLTHHNIVNNASLSAGILRFTEDDRLCIPVPMYHCFGMVLGSLLCAIRGAAIVFPSAGFDAAAVLDAVESERCTAVHGVPTMFIAALDEPDFARRDLGSLRTGIMAGAPCPVELMKRVIDEMHLAEITIGYGMTETGPLSTQTSIDDPLERRVTTVGRAMPHTEIKVVDEQGRIVPRGESGELCTRGYCVMRGYWGDPERTAEEIDAAHWIRTGDIAEIDAAGYVSIVGRLKDMIIRGGENIYPREIEEFLYTHPKIDEVEVFGVPDRKFGEQVAVWIRLREDETASAEEIRDFCRSKLAHFKVPQYIKFVAEFPMTVTGKVQKFVMRDAMVEELGLTSGNTKQ